MASQIPVKPTVSNGAHHEVVVTGQERQAYVTFLAGDGDYVKGVVGLAKGLRKVGATFPLVVAVLPDVPPEHRRVLAEQGCLLRDIEPVFPPANGGSQFVRPYFAINYCKIRLWEFVEYEKMIYMDADIQVFDNIDHLFNMPGGGYLYGVVDCLCEMYGNPCPQKLRWPQELGPQPSFYLNGGMFMFEPNLSTYDELMSTFKVTPPTPFAEQDFLNMFFKEKSRPIPPMYNLLVAMLWRHPELVDLEKVKVVHYCVAGSKPWRYTGKEEYMNRMDIKILIKKWWEIYNDTTLDFYQGVDHHLDSARNDGRDGMVAIGSVNGGDYQGVDHHLDSARNDGRGGMVAIGSVNGGDDGRKLAATLSKAEVVVRYRSASTAA